MMKWRYKLPTMKDYLALDKTEKLGLEPRDIVCGIEKMIEKKHKKLGPLEYGSNFEEENFGNSEDILNDSVSASLLGKTNGYISDKHYKLDTISTAIIGVNVQQQGSSYLNLRNGQSNIDIDFNKKPAIRTILNAGQKDILDNTHSTGMYNNILRRKQWRKLHLREGQAIWNDHFNKYKGDSSRLNPTDRSIIEDEVNENSKGDLTADNTNGYVKNLNYKMPAIGNCWSFDHDIRKVKNKKPNEVNPKIIENSHPNKPHSSYRKNLEGNIKDEPVNNEFKMKYNAVEISDTVQGRNNCEKNFLQSRKQYQKMKTVRENKQKQTTEFVVGKELWVKSLSCIYDSSSMLNSARGGISSRKNLVSGSGYLL